MQVPVITISYTAANVSNPAGRVATGLPLPSTAPQRGEGLRVRGGHIQSPLPFLPVSAPSGVPAEHFPQNPLINTFITMNERLQTRVARATGPYRPATRRTERVRRSFCQRTPFVIGASSLVLRHSFVIQHFVIRHSQTEIIKNPRNITFYDWCHGMPGKRAVRIARVAL